ncbi:MAG: hypothetical protein KCHDKBKB_01200 [Elusimicrobia bacterium]|nr:hypothetical protein [Elusimicrobiota bacterium]
MITKIHRGHSISLAKFLFVVPLVLVAITPETVVADYPCNGFYDDTLGACLEENDVISVEVGTPQDSPLRGADFLFNIHTVRSILNTDPPTELEDYLLANPSQLNVWMPSFDGDNDSITYSLISGPYHGTVLVYNNFAEYTPGQGVNNIIDTFVLLEDDGRGGRGYRVINVRIGNPSGDLPEAENLTESVTFGNPLSFSLDYKGLIHHLTEPLPHRGAATLSESGIVTYTPNAYRADDDAMVYTAKSGDNYISAIVHLDISEPQVMSAELRDGTFTGPVVATFGLNYGEQTARVDTTVFPDGERTFVAVAGDQTGRVASQSVRVIIDNTPPTCVYNPVGTPDENTWVKGNVSFTVTSIDNVGGSGVQGVNLVGPHNGQIYPYLRVAGSADWLFENFNTWLLADGPNLFESECFDRAGNISGRIPRNLNVDNVVPAPTLTFDPLPSGQVLRGLATVNVIGNDGTGSGVSRVSLKLDGSLLATSFPFSLNSAGYPEGFHTLEAEVEDNLGNKATSSRNLNFDQSAPLITITQPLEGSRVAAGFNQLHATLTDLNGIDDSSIEIVVDGVVMSHTRSGNIFSLASALSSNGPHSLVVRAKDSVGNQGSSELRTIVLTGGTVPGGGNTVQFISPLHGQEIAGQYPLRVFNPDPTVTSIVVSINGANSLPLINDGDGIWKLDVDTNQYPEGSTTLEIRSENGSTTAQQSVTVSIDRTNPEVTSFVPAQGQNVSGVMPIVVAITDNQSVNSVRILVDGESVAVSQPNGSLASTSLSYSWDTTLFSNGTHGIQVEVMDQAGNIKTETRNVTVLNGPAVLPTITILEPRTGDAISGITPFRMLVQGTFSSVGIRIDDGPLIPAVQVPGTNEYRTNINTTIPTPGPHIIKFVADTTFVTANVYFDNIAPTVVVEAPTNGQSIFLIKNIIVRASDNSSASNIPLQEVRLSLGSTPLAFFPGHTDLSNNTYSYALDTTNSAFPDGSYSLMVTAQDKAGNETTVIVPFQINNAEPPISSGAQVDWTPVESFAVGPTRTAVSATISNVELVPTSVNESALTCVADKDGQSNSIPGRAVLDGRTVKFQGVIPSNANVTCLLRVIEKGTDNIERLIRRTKSFTSGMDRSLGGTVKLYPDDLLTLSIPAEALKNDALIRMVKSPAGELPLDGKEIVYGPIEIRAIDANGLATTLQVAARMEFKRNINEIPEPRRYGFVDQAEIYSTNFWKVLGPSGIAATTKDNPQVRGVTVSIEQFGVIRITSLAVPPEGISNLLNMPNPFSPAEGGTDFNYLLGSDSEVTLVMYDLFGGMVKKMEFGSGSNGGKFGPNVVHWDGRNGAGEIVANGGYILQITAKDNSGKTTRARYKVGVAK